MVFFQCFPVHVAQHQHFAAGGVGGDAGDQAVLVELRCQLLAFFHLFDGQARGEQRFAAWRGWVCHVMGSCQGSRDGPGGVASRKRSGRPCRGVPARASSRTATWPRTMVWIGQPVTVVPS